MLQLNINQYKHLLTDGWCPVWVGRSCGLSSLSLVKSDGWFEVAVYLRKESLKIARVIRLEVPDVRYKVIRKNSSLVPAFDTVDRHSMFKDRSTNMSLVRLATSLGIGPYSSVDMGIKGSTIQCSDSLIAGLDIETTTFVRDGGFPMFMDPIISIALVFNDDTRYFGYTTGNVSNSRRSQVECVKFPDSGSCVDWIMYILITRCPDFVCIHNGFMYDVPVMAYHASRFMKGYFSEIKLGKSGTGYNVNIPGCYVIDTFFYLDKLHRSDYQSLSLGNLSKALKLPLKLGSPGFNIKYQDDSYPMDSMLDYNLHDAWLHIAVAVHTKCIDEMRSLCSVTKCPFEDVSRFISGSMVTSLLVSEGLSEGYAIDWTEPMVPMFMRYKGALVIDPMVGVHKNVSVYDVKSMYPNIMINLRVSQENIFTFPDNQSASASTHRDIPLMAPGSYCAVNSWYIYRSEHGYHMFADKDVMTSTCLTKLIKYRSAVGKTTMTGWALKIVSNSMYGAIGASTSGLYDPLCAGTVTGVGRWITEVSTLLIRMTGSKVVYGDTDSVFVVPRSGVSSASVLSIVHRIFGYLGLRDIRFEMEETYSSVIIVKKKMYYARVADSDQTKVKGLAYRRQDRIDLARWAVDDICHILTNAKEPQMIAKAYLLELFRKVDTNQVPMNECVIQVKVDGVAHIGYRNPEGRLVILEPKDASSHSYDICPKWVKKSVARAVDPVIEAAGISTCEDLLSRRYV